MGIALIIEGLLSACYHICPSQSNYQFGNYLKHYINQTWILIILWINFKTFLDTSFMYVMAVLCMIKLYQNRHPDINATAYTTFTVLGVAIFMGKCHTILCMLWLSFILSNYTRINTLISMQQLLLYSVLPFS